MQSLSLMTKRPQCLSRRTIPLDPCGPYTLLFSGHLSSNCHRCIGPLTLLGRQLVVLQLRSLLRPSLPLMQTQGLFSLEFLSVLSLVAFSALFLERSLSARWLVLCLPA